MTRNFKEYEKTAWFPADIEPVHVGLYECDRWIPKPGRDDYANDRVRSVFSVDGHLMGLSGQRHAREYVREPRRQVARLEARGA